MTTRLMPKSYNGCTCICHTVPGVKHIAACCGAIFRAATAPRTDIPVTPEEDEYWQERERILKEKQQ